MSPRSINRSCKVDLTCLDYKLFFSINISIHAELLECIHLWYRHYLINICGYIKHFFKGECSTSYFDIFLNINFLNTYVCIILLYYIMLITYCYYTIFKKKLISNALYKKTNNWELRSNALMWLECIILFWPQGSFHYSSRYNCYCKLMSFEYTIIFRGTYSKNIL